MFKTLEQDYIAKISQCHGCCFNKVQCGTVKNRRFTIAAVKNGALSCQIREFWIIEFEKTYLFLNKVCLLFAIAIGVSLFVLND